MNFYIKRIISYASLTFLEKAMKAKRREANKSPIQKGRIITAMKSTLFHGFVHFWTMMLAVTAQYKADRCNPSPT